MSTLARKNTSSPIELSDLLKKRKTSLACFVKNFGIFTYEELKARCEKIGAKCPSIEVFQSLNIPKVTVQTEGILVLATAEETLPTQFEEKNSLYAEDNVLESENLVKKKKKNAMVISNKNEEAQESIE